MLTNATLKRIDVKTGASSSGTPVYTVGADVAVRCAIDSPTHAQKYTLGSVVKDATAVLYVLVPDLQGAGILTGLPESGRVLVQLDGADEQLLQILAISPRIKPSLNHFEAFLKGI